MGGSRRRTACRGEGWPAGGEVCRCLFLLFLFVSFHSFIQFINSNFSPFMEAREPPTSTYIATTTMAAAATAADQNGDKQTNGQTRSRWARDHANEQIMMREG